MLRFVVATIFILFAAPAYAACAALPEPGAPSLKDAAVTEVCHKGYDAMVDDAAKVPLWVAYTLTGPHSLGCHVRVSDFHSDPLLPKGSAKPVDYNKSGYDKGHQAPAEDFAWNADEEYDSFSMANMTPQKPGLNRQQWERLEATVRSWAVLDGPLSIYVGPVFGGTKHIGKNKVAVPIGFWKVIVCGKFDAVAFYMDNKLIKKGDLLPYQVSIAKVDQLAHITLPITPLSEAKLPPLPPADLAGWEKQHKKACK